MATSQNCLPFRTPMGLLTTVAQLPPKYKIRYLARTFESPLDLSVKPIAPLSTTETPPPVQTNINNGPMTPPPSPPKKRYRDEEMQIDDQKVEDQSSKLIKTDIELTVQKEVTPSKPIKVVSAPKTSKNHPNTTSTKEKKSKVTRRLKFDEETSSPVSGTIIRPLEEIGLDSLEQSGDIDPQYNIVEVTEEAKAELAAIKNVIGAYVCKLCRIEFEDAFGLARHRCSCIVLLEYRCPECGKRFNCPANLASHRRWHKPKDQVMKKQSENQENDQQYPCSECGKTFKRQAYLRKHLATHKKDQTSPNDQNSKSIKSSDESNSNESHQLTIYEGSRLYRYDSDMESRSSNCSSPGPLRIVESLTEEENIAAAALAHLRTGQSVIQHTTALAF